MLRNLIEKTLARLGLLEFTVPFKKAWLGRGDGFLKGCKGVVHVGAHTGEERILYWRYSLPVLWVEALPDMYETLRRNIRGYPQQAAINALLTDRNDEDVDFHVSDNAGASSSIYAFKAHSQLWPDVAMARTVRMRSQTLPAVLRAAGRPASDFDALILDVQGAELAVLTGAAPLLPLIRFVKAEVADFELYEGACTLKTLTTAMKAWGFVVRHTHRFASKKGVGSCYDVLFERATSAARGGAE